MILLRLDFRFENGQIVVTSLMVYTRAGLDDSSLRPGCRAPVGSPNVYIIRPWRDHSIGLQRAALNQPTVWILLYFVSSGE